MRPACTVPVVIAAAIAVAGAVSRARAQQPVPIRPLGPVVATAAEAFGAVTAVRQLAGGRVLVNDGTKRRLLLFDSTLAQPIVVADSTSATANAYGARAGGMIPYAADSTLFVDGAALSLLVIDPNGKIARIASVPRPADINYLTSTAYGAGFDGKGNLVYRTQPPLRIVTGPDGNAMISQPPDSLAIIRVNLATRAADTAAWVRVIRNPPLRSVRSVDGKTSTTYFPVLPYKPADDWTLVADGSIAIIYAQDFHVDWIPSAGQRTTSPRVVFPWKRLTDDDKAQLIDSMQAQYARIQRSSDSAAVCRPAPPPGAIVGRTVYEVGATSDVPDYAPAFRSSSAKADMDGNIWISEYSLPAGIAGQVNDVNAGPVYDVINRNGELFDRVRLPDRTSLAGFGPDIAYLTIRDTLPKPPPPPPPDPVTGCRPPAQPILLSQLPPVRLLRARIH